MANGRFFIFLPLFFTRGNRTGMFYQEFWHTICFSLTVCRPPAVRITPAAQARNRVELIYSLLSLRFGMARIYADADRTVPLFSVFLGGAVFFNVPLTFRSKDYYRF